MPSACRIASHARAETPKTDDTDGFSRQAEADRKPLLKRPAPDVCVGCGMARAAARSKPRPTRRVASAWRRLPVLQNNYMARGAGGEIQRAIASRQ